MARETRRKIPSLERILDHEMASGVPTLCDAFPWEITKPIARTIRNKRLAMYKAIDAAMALHRNRKISGKYLMPGMHGSKLVKSTLDDAMQRLKKLMKEREMVSHHTREKGREDEPSDLFWTLHNLKRKGVSDANDNRIAGHRSDAMRANYDVKVRSFKAPR